MSKKPDASQLFVAAENGNTQVIIELLSKRGAKVDAKEATFGMTALHIAASKGHKEVVELLIANGSNLEAREETGRTPLHAASFRGQLEIVQLLVAKGAAINAQTKDAKTPLDWAFVSNKTEVANFIKENGGKSGKELTPAPAPAAAAK